MASTKPTRDSHATKEKEHVSARSLQQEWQWDTHATKEQGRTLVRSFVQNRERDSYAARLLSLSHMFFF